MSPAAIDKIVVNILDSLYRWKKQLAIILVIVAIFLLLAIINRVSSNNSAWLQGNWQNSTVDYTFKPQNTDFKEWSIKCEGKTTLKPARVSVNSSKKRVIMTDDRNSIEYHAIRIGRDQLRLKVMEDGKTSSVLDLKKE